MPDLRVQNTEDPPDDSVLYEPVVKMVGITKRFPGVLANDAVDFDLRPGEVHTLLGENGAGKTTLMCILSGLYQPDSGTIEINGERAQMGSPYDSLRLGIGIVHQHFALVPPLTVIENIVLGFEDGVVLNLKKAEEKLLQIFEESGLPLDLGETVWNLSVGQQQRVEIVKTLFRGSDVLILDEPTSVLTPIEADELFQTISRLRELGKSIVFITHKLGEALKISDRITVLKLGKKVSEMSGEKLRQMGEEAAARHILDVMFGDKPFSESDSIAKTIHDELVLELKEVECMDNRGAMALKRVSLNLRRGEIFGVAGVDGNGQKELAEVIAGQRGVVSGSILFQTRNITDQGTGERSNLGISYITDDATHEGCVLSMSLAENSILRLYNRSPFSRWKVLDNSVIDDHTGKLIEEFNIKATGGDVRVGTLSGGNIQKFLLARELSMKPSVIVCNKPTHGLDARTTRYVQELILNESTRGVAVLLISSDLDELLCYSDRIGVLYNGEILDVLDRSEASPERVGKLMLGMRQ
jgi:simple sugar transport system ATP-binding protein